MSAPVSALKRSEWSSGVLRTKAPMRVAACCAAFATSLILKVVIAPVSAQHVPAVKRVFVATNTSPGQ
jgi:hypothetical protein